MKTKYHSYKSGSLAKGCQLCVKGRKSVLFVTGLCARHCYFCPISNQKRNKDVVYINEWPTKKVKDIIKEIELCSSKGVGITGGDPLIKIDRVTKLIKKLKKKFGKKFHIHLYTPLNLVNEKSLKKLNDAGLDEIRFHPDIDNDFNWDMINLSRKYKWDIGVEIPAIPKKEKQIKKL
ncbi:MAG: radical SAM protein, partial [Nanoarchaeota archaeon]|nr:radical SAM protein [Nanoarchaeota archaeon]